MNPLTLNIFFSTYCVIDKAVQTFYLDSLDPSDSVGAAKRAKKISSTASFFRVGQCMGMTLVCVVKSGSVSSTIKALQPVDAPGRGKKQPALRKFLQGSNESLKVYREVRSLANSPLP